MIPENHNSHASPFKHYEGYKALALDTIIVENVLDFDLYIDNSGRLVKFVNAGNMLHADKKEKLLFNRVDHFYISTLDAKLFDRYLTDHLGVVLNAPGLDKTQKSKIIYSSSIHIMQEMFESDVSASRIFRAKALMTETVKRIISNEVTAASILQVSSHDYKTYSHSVNVALYAIGMAHEFGMTDKEIEQIASGAILHDVGKCRIDRCIINKPDRLSHAEFETIKEHPQYGYETLMENGETDPVILDIVRNHHEKLDGSGYMRGLSGDAISQATQIVTIADIFDALTSNRPYKDAAALFTALKTMKVQMGAQLNMAFVDALIRMMGRA